MSAHKVMKHECLDLVGLRKVTEFIQTSVSSNEGNADQKKFWSLWETISREVRRWVQERDHAPQPFFVRMPPQKTARIALSALEEAVQHGDEGIEQVCQYTCLEELCIYKPCVEFGSMRL